MMHFTKGWRVVFLMGGVAKKAAIVDQIYDTFGETATLAGFSLLIGPVGADPVQYKLSKLQSLVKLLRPLEIVHYEFANAPFETYQTVLPNSYRFWDRSREIGTNMTSEPVVALRRRRPVAQNPAPRQLDPAGSQAVPSAPAITKGWSSMQAQNWGATAPPPSRKSSPVRHLSPNTLARSASPAGQGWSARIDHTSPATTSSVGQFKDPWKANVKAQDRATSLVPAGAVTPDVLAGGFGQRTAMRQNAVAVEETRAERAARISARIEARASAARDNRPFEDLWRGKAAAQDHAAVAEAKGKAVGNASTTKPVAIFNWDRTMAPGVPQSEHFMDSSNIAAPYPFMVDIMKHYLLANWEVHVLTNRPDKVHTSEPNSTETILKHLSAVKISGVQVHAANLANRSKGSNHKLDFFNHILDQKPIVIVHYEDDERLMQSCQKVAMKKEISYLRYFISEPGRLDAVKFLDADFCPILGFSQTGSKPVISAGSGAMHD